MIQIELKDLYQFLISECRYGYTRNNHLMPDGAYDHAKKYLPKMLISDKNFAIDTAKQLCEECIDQQLCGNFYDGRDDVHSNRACAIKFIEYLLDFIHKYEENYIPYNNDNYLNNLNKDKDPRYAIYSLKDNDEIDKCLNPQLLSVETLLAFLFKAKTCYYNKYNGVELGDIIYNIDNIKYLVRDVELYNRRNNKNV